MTEFKKTAACTHSPGKERSDIRPRRSAQAYRQDLRNVEVHLLDTGHFALEEDPAVIAGRIRGFMKE